MRKDIIIGILSFLGFISGSWGANFGGFNVHNLDALLAREPSADIGLGQALEGLFQAPDQFQGLTDLEETTVRTYFAQFRFAEDEINAFVEAVDNTLRSQGGLSHAVQIQTLFDYFGVVDVQGDRVAQVLAHVNEGLGEVEAFYRVIFSSLGFGDRLAREHAGTMRLALAGDLGGLNMQSIFIKQVYRALGFVESELNNILAEVFGNPDLPIDGVNTLWPAFAYVFFKHFFFSHNQALNAAQYVGDLLQQGYCLRDALLRAFLRAYNSSEIVGVVGPSYRNFMDRGIGSRDAMLRVMLGLYGVAGRAADDAVGFYASMFANGRRHDNLLGVFLLSFYCGGLKVDATLANQMVQYALANRASGSQLHVMHWRAVFSAMGVLPGQQKRVRQLFAQNLEAGHIPWYAFARAYLVLNNVPDIERAMEQLKVYQGHELVAHPLEALKCALFEQTYKIKDIKQLLGLVRLYNGVKLSRK